MKMTKSNGGSKTDTPGYRSTDSEEELDISRGPLITVMV